jgi:glyoxylase-like metal-dependent hydrolase (beta-lactamase superfamily II)
VRPLSGGEVQFPAAMFERPGGPFEALKVSGLFTPRASGWWWVPCPAVLITHPSAGPILVDTSLHSSIAAEPGENFGRLAARYARPRIEPGRDLPSQLRELGADPRSIPLVVMTHLHFDHASGISEFPSSTFVISGAEWSAATTGSRALLRGYRPQHYDFAFDYRLVDFDGPRIDSYASFGRCFDLFGDGSVRLAFTPGHTLGHMCVLARLRDRDFVIAGDAVYTVRQLEGGPEPPRPHDAHLWRRSLQELRLFARTYPDAMIVAGHDPEQWAGLEARYD